MAIDFWPLWGVTAGNQRKCHCRPTARLTVRPGPGGGFGAAVGAPVGGRSRASCGTPVAASCRLFARQSPACQNLDRENPVFSLKIRTFATHLSLLNKLSGIMNNYELMVIFTPVLSEEDYKAAQKKYAALVKENGGEIVHDNPWGLKSLA